ncbi:helix-turn-helix domain-containing protein [Grimontia hollisae]|uniref:Various polyols ABC transporter substrate-binding protein n=1 Tax=Grimontia hollisae CIP 101886 TaxID=675812 RepID=D0I587_GRIHO|nr:helix-turn-helix domain-containing protein [Grimontia hollisae]EEY73051.1 various polyols ABC transporter substrate-binding protein [Grimontia hollisae CIP 101886]MDF2183946.1 extracellular solute-binding protein [Grimontia hollisae]STO77715.1 Bacterial extracellular solute-binding protein [Grimontia hollisae]STQ76240.1 Bacterial extracellular solute-binding protein [Grimontia hollisae]
MLSKRKTLTIFAAAFAALSASAYAATELTIATVNNGHMIEMQKLSKAFEKQNPDIKLNWVTLEEGVLRQRVTTDIATKGGQFDVMAIGMYETPIWGEKGWLKEIQTDAAYDAVAGISQTVGFHNLANFSRQFRRIKGLSPLAYRKKHAPQIGIN